MTDRRVPRRCFGVQTVELDLPPLAGALSQRLRDAGVPVTPSRAADFARALGLVRPITRRRLYWTARAVLVSDPAQLAAFDATFRAVFGARLDREEFVPDAVQTVPASADDRPTPDHKTSSRDSGEAESRAGGSFSTPGEGDQEEDATALEMPVAVASDEERLARRSFDTLRPGELAAVYRLMSRLELATPLRRTRRYKRGRHGEHVDVRRTLRASLRTGGDPIRLRRRRRRVVPRRLVMLCDISGSMEPYARAYLQFLICAARPGPGRNEAFAFATRLTRLTRALASRNPERAIQRAGAAAPDWASGTRIGDALKAFNDRHGRRGMARGAVVVIISDGWERGDPALVGREMQRLARLAHRIVWVNPRAAANAFDVQAGGMVAALPYCDALVSGHSLQALDAVVEAIGVPGAGRSDWSARRRCTPAAAAEAEIAEPWASATPVPGSSVAMPSGHGPSRGNTTAGWATEDSDR